MSKIAIHPDKLQEIYESSKGHSLDWLRTGIQGLFPDAEFLEVKEIFLSALYSFLCSGKIKLAKNGVFLPSTHDYQIKIFSDAWPERDIYNKDNPNLDFYWWFFDESCPAGAVWVNDNGTLEWT